MTESSNLQVWAVARDDVVLVVSALCPEHASRVKAGHGLLLGLHSFRVQARAWVRRVLRDRKRCTECAAGAGAPLRIVDAGTARVAELALPGGDA